MTDLAALDLNRPPKPIRNKTIHQDLLSKVDLGEGSVEYTEEYIRDHGSQLSKAQLFALLPKSERLAILRSLTDRELKALLYDWRFWARPQQLPPKENWWTVWLILAGRGFGKTRTGAELVIEKAKTKTWKRIALIGSTAADVRDVMIEGESGIRACSPPWFRPKYEPSKRRLTFPNGVVATAYSAEISERLRGPQHDGGWADELAAWRYTDAWDMFLFGLRLGRHPQVVVTTTPRPTELIKNLNKDEKTFVTRGSTYDNLPNLANSFIREIKRKYENTELGRQEIKAEILEDIAGALWTQANLDILRVYNLPELFYIVVAIDPAVSNNQKSDETGIVVVGISEYNHLYVIDDVSRHGDPEEWAKEAIYAFIRYQADMIVAETNNGGDLVEAVLRTVEIDGKPVGRQVPFTKVHASRGKRVRAEPIASIYKQGRGHHLGHFASLESQMTTWTPNSGDSPDRMDALVWGATYLTTLPLDQTEEPPLLSDDYVNRVDELSRLYGNSLNGRY